MVNSDQMGSKDKKEKKEPMAPLKVWLPAVALGWLLPGGGHLLLKRRVRGALVLFAVAATFLFGIMLRGVMFEPKTGDLLTTIIYCGGFLGDLASGVFYLLASWLGYAQPDLAGHMHDYGTKFLVTAGLLNVLAMVDAYEIAAGKKS
jgi:hypothetical protein